MSLVCRAGLLAAGAVITLGCRKPFVSSRGAASSPTGGVTRDSAVAAGLVEVRWRGSDTGRMAGPGVAEWCPVGRFVLVRGTQGDTGIGIVLYPHDSLAAGDYPVTPPTVIDSMPRPSSAVALRWFGASAVLGFRGRTGMVTLDRGGRGMSGRFQGSAIATGRPDTISVAGGFRSLRVRLAAPSCADKDNAGQGE